MSSSPGSTAGGSSVVEIQDPDDPRLDDYRNVPDPDIVRRRGLFVAEGRLVVRRLLLESRMAVRSMLLTAATRDALTDATVIRRDVTAYLVSQAVMDRITGFHIHRGCLALGERPAPWDWRDAGEGLRTVLMLERVANADNVGSIFRSAAAFGADGVLLDDATTDPLYRKAIRTSMGAALVVPFARAVPWLDAIGELQARGVATVAMTPCPDAPSIHSVRRDTGRRPVALVFGHEGDGLSDATIHACEFRSRIPVAPSVDSLNVSTAAAISLYEWRRQDDI